MARIFGMIFRELLLQLDQWLRVPLGWQVQRFGELRDDPLGYFDRMGEVRIGPGHRNAVAAFFAFWASIAIFTAFAWSTREVGLPKLPPWGNLGVIIGGFILAFLGARAVFRGGELRLAADGVRFRDRGNEVYCPWRLFATTERVQRPDQTVVVVPIRPDAADEVFVTRSAGGTSRGYETSARPFRFVGEDRAELEDLYRCWLPGVVGLIRDVANRLEVGVPVSLSRAGMLS